MRFIREFVSRGVTRNMEYNYQNIGKKIALTGEVLS